MAIKKAGKRIAAALLAVSMVLPNMSYIPTNAAESTVKIASVDTDTDEFRDRTYNISKAPDMEDVTADFPMEAQAVTDDGEDYTVTISAWKSNDYDNTSIGKYTFYAVSDGDEKIPGEILPWITVNIIEDPVVISGFDEEFKFESLIYDTRYAPALDELLEEYQDTGIPAFDENGEETTVTVSDWGDDGYDPEEPGAYIFSPVIDELVYDISDAGDVPFLAVTVTEPSETEITAEYEDVTAALTMDPGVVPAGTTMEIAVPEDEDAASFEEAVLAKAEGSVTVYGVYDISLYDEYGEDVQPDGTVTLSFDGIAETEKDAASVSIYHFKDDDADNIEMLDVTTDGTTVSVETNSFSTYVIAKTKTSGPARVSRAASDSAVTSIKTFVSQLVSGAEKNENGDYVWTPSTSSTGHAFKFRVNYSTSGKGKIDPAVVQTTTEKKKTTITGVEGGIQIRIPASIVKDRNGNADDTYEMSILSYDDMVDMDDTDLVDEEWAYCILKNDDGTEDIVVYNRKTVTAAKSGYFEVVYKTKSQTYEYIDYGAENAGFNPFEATISASGIKEKTDGVVMYVDTSAAVKRTKKDYPTQSTKWSSRWGEYTPDEGDAEDGSDYYWQEWVIETNSTGTQRYDLVLNDNIVSSTLDCEVYGYKISGNFILASDIEAGTAEAVGEGLTQSTNYSYVITRIKKSDIEDENGDYKVSSFRITNRITVTEKPYDGVDDETTASDTTTYYWSEPVKPVYKFNETAGARLDKYGDENWSERYSGRHRYYVSYDLDQLQSGDDSLRGINYEVTFSAWPYGWTRETGSDINDYTKYGQGKVTYEISDSKFYPLNKDGTQTVTAENGTQTTTTRFSGTGTPTSTDLEEAVPLNPEDYDIEYVNYSLYAFDAKREDGVLVINKYKDYIVSGVTFSEEDILAVYTMSDNEWSKAGEYNLGNKTWTAEEGSKVKEITESRITFDTGVDGFKVMTTNGYYRTSFNSTVYAKLYRTENVLNWIGTGDDAKEVVMLKNIAEATVTSESGNTLYSSKDMSGDRIRATQRSSSISKRTTSAFNDVKSKTYKIGWSISAYERYTTGSGTSQYMEQESGTFYDLLPKGANLVSGSLYVNGIADNEYDVETVYNYKGSGRTLLIVRIDTPADSYNVSYTTIIPWTSVTDYGTAVTNPVAYETGNDKIANGKADDPEGQLSADNRKYYKFLHYTQEDADNGSIPNTFIYTEDSHNIVAITAASTGLSKNILSSATAKWTSETFVTRNETYRYRLRYENTYTAKTKGIVLFDSIENYKEGGDNGDEASQWKGTLSSVDVAQIRAIVSLDENNQPYKNADGSSVCVAPIVYYSTVEDLDLSRDENHDVTTLGADGSVWQELTDDTDLSTVTAVAVDCRKDEAGNDFVMQPGTSLSAVLYMKAPEKVTDAPEGSYPAAYNNVYMNLCVADVAGEYKTDDDGNLVTDYIYYDYTTAKFKTSSSFGVFKANEKDLTEAVNGITFRLYGTSDYGTAVDQNKTTDKNGKISFKDIEKGTYILQETACTKDWLEDHTEHAITIDADAKVTIDGQDYTPEKSVLKYVTITNKPRIHTDVSFTKIDSESNMAVSGATFMLFGTSDYGTDYYVTKASMGSGKVTFADVEKGTYTIQEISAPKGYFLNKTLYSVTVDESGTFSIAEKN